MKRTLLSLLLLGAILSACSGEKTEAPATTPAVEATVATDSLSQPEADQQSLEAQTLKTTQEVDSLLQGI